MKNLHEVITDTKTTITEIVSDGRKLWKVISSSGEELTGEIGYKVFNSDWTCRRMRYTVGKKFEENVEPSLCHRGLHYCPTAADCFNYYDFNPNNKVALVLAYGDIDDGYGTSDKHCTNKLYIVREIPWSELLEIANEGKGNTGLRNTGNRNTGNRNTGDGNTGNRNTGDGNTGDGNTGDGNTGDGNTGDGNTGNRNTGDGNTGNRNTGDGNTGNRNTGDGNFGSRCTGDYNIADDSSGVFCTEKQTIKIFDEDSGLTIEQWRRTEAYDLLLRVDDQPTVFVADYDMTEDEKKSHPDYVQKGGYLKAVGYDPMRFVKWWNNLSDSQKREIMNIPNFNSEKFRKITGIDVNNPDHHTRCYRSKFHALEVGTKVRITITDSYDGPFGKNSSMVALNGQIATITGIKSKNDDPAYNDYNIDLDEGYWNWSCLMFELCEE